MNISFHTADAIDSLVESLRKLARETAQELDLARARNRRLYEENIALATQVRRLEAEKDRLVEQLDEALLAKEPD